MATYEFRLPDIGEGVVEGEIVKWLVKAGETIAEDHPVVEVMTDKATVTVPSPRGGKVVKTFGQEGDMAKVHQVLALLETEAGAAADAPKASAPKPPLPAVAAVASPRPEAASAKRVLATPVTRRMARELGLDLSALTGSGPQGRVTKVDVESAARQPAPESAGRPTHSFAALPSREGDQRLPIRGMRKKIADKMVKSKFTAPHYTFVEEIDATPLVEMKERLGKNLEEGTKLSFIPFFMKALVQALRKHPMVNANMDEAKQELILRGEYNLGMAVMTDDGLTVPVVHGADRLTLRQLASEVSRLAAAARDRKLKVEELSGGTFTLTSLGNIGGLFATPILNHPEVGIMGVHKLRKRPVVDEEGDIVVRQMMYLSFSFDHRIVDGAAGAEFAYSVIRGLANPENLLLDMA